MNDGGWDVEGCDFNSSFVHFQLAPWLAVEIPDLIEKGIVTYTEKDEAK